MPEQDKTGLVVRLLAPAILAAAAAWWALGLLEVGAERGCLTGAAGLVGLFLSGAALGERLYGGAVERARGHAPHPDDALSRVAHDLVRRAMALENPNDVWPLLADRLIATFSCDRVSIFQRNAKDQLVSRYAHGLNIPVTIKMGEGIAGHAAAIQAPYVSNDPYNDPKFNTLIDRLTHYKTQNLLAFPLAYQGRNVGVVELVNKPGGFQPRDIESMEFLGSQVAVLFVKFKFEERQDELVRQMIQVEKMAAVGRMAGGIAHEMNNPISAILVLSQRLLKLVSDTPPALEAVLKLDASARRMRLVVQNLLGFSRTAPPILSRVVLSEVMDSSLSLISHELENRSVEIVKDYEKSAPAIMGDSNHLEQVFVNLMINALHAMEGQPRSRLVLRVRGDVDGGGVVAEVTDNGPGIPPEIAEKIFEPFFTTKEADKGTGLGLYIVSQIVERHKGHIVVAAPPDGGALFRLTFPKA